VPATVQAVLAARIDRLPPEDKRLLQPAAVIGTEVPWPLLQAIADGPEEALHQGLTRLQAAEFLYEARLFPELAYTFKHALTHKALAYYRQAGGRATARTAYREAVAYFEQALAALAHLPERHETLPQAIDLRFDLRNALLPLDEQARLFDHLRAAEPLAERLGDPQRLGRIVSFLCFSFSVMGEHDRAIAAGQRALATTSGAFDVQVNAQNNLSVAYYAAGHYRQPLDVSQRMIAVLTGDRLSERFGLPIFPGLLGRGYAALCLAELGGFAEGAGIGEEAVRLAEAVAQPNSMLIVLYCVGLCYRRQGMLQKAIPMLERGLALSQSVDIPLQFPMTSSFLSAAYALAGRAAEALPLLDQMLERLATGRRMLLHALVLTELSEACLLVGRVDEARALAARLLELSHTHTGHGYQAHACGSLARSPGVASRWTSTRPKPTTARPLPWPTSWACARCRRIATWGSVPSSPRSANGSRLVPHWPQLSTSTVPWT